MLRPCSLHSNIFESNHHHVLWNDIEYIINIKSSPSKNVVGFRLRNAPAYFYLRGGWATGFNTSETTRTLNIRILTITTSPKAQLLLQY